MFQSSKHQRLTIASGASFSSAINIERFDALMVYLPAVVAAFGAGTVEISLYGAYDSAVAAVPVSYYDCGNGTTDAAKVSAATAGLFEMPYGGSPPVIQLVFNTACTGGINIDLVYHQS